MTYQARCSLNQRKVRNVVKFNKKDRKKATRMYSSDSPIGIALFEGGYDQPTRKWVGRQVGFLANKDEAERWLKNKLDVTEFIVRN